MSPIPFVTLADPHYGEAVSVSPLIRRVIARNPSKYTYLGTGTYIVGHGDVAVIDPGPLVDGHREALAAALEGERVRTIVVTHCHADHSPLAKWLHETTGAPTVAFGPHGAVDEEPDVLDDEKDDGDKDPHAPEEPKETIDVEFEPDVRVADGEVAATGPGYTLRAVHTPGHTSNHMCFALAEEKALFTGDHIMGWSTTVVTPPDGDMAQYMASVKKLQARDDAILYPTHGAPITAPKPFLAAYLEHRYDRENQVLAAVADGLATIPDMVARMYADVNKGLWPAASRSVLAHLIKLEQEGRVAQENGQYRLVS